MLKAQTSAPMLSIFLIKLGNFAVPSASIYCTRYYAPIQRPCRCGGEDWDVPGTCVMNASRRSHAFSDCVVRVKLHAVLDCHSKRAHLHVRDLILL